MSYILEALKKSERIRRRDPVPDLQSIHEIALKERPAQPAAWSIILIMVLCINIVLLAWLLVPEKQQETAAMQVIVPPLPADSAIDQVLVSRDIIKVVPPAREVPAVEPDPAPVAAIEVREQPEQVAAVSLPATIIAPAGRSVPIAAEVREPAREAAVVMPPDDAAEDQYRDIPYIGSLPMSIRNNLPEINISIHSYARKPASRLVRINGHMFREGQQVTDDLALLEITKEGIVLDYKGEPFRILVVMTGR